MDYLSKITAIGELVSDFAEEGILIVFNDNAPPELAEMSILHTIVPLDREVKPGDKVVLGNQTYLVTAVGEEANHTLRNMGHCTFKFTGKNKPEIGGHIELKGNGMPEVKPGDPFEIFFK
ncbi:MAG: PTS glucitol/sorbitol transporter subunit IIA [Spirochaetales bacterium]|jgi:PTS system glucitol/sorbitol-specific IIA component|nr:PTS glucitol/sorbitol transporter subunit IIA [Spirochaetales bacterium]